MRLAHQILPVRAGENPRPADAAAAPPATHRQFIGQVFQPAEALRPLHRHQGALALIAGGLARALDGDLKCRRHQRFVPDMRLLPIAPRSPIRLEQDFERLALQRQGETLLGGLQRQAMADQRRQIHPAGAQKLR